MVYQVAKRTECSTLKATAHPRGGAFASWVVIGGGFEEKKLKYQAHLLEYSAPNCGEKQD